VQLQSWLEDAEMKLKTFDKSYGIVLTSDENLNDEETRLEDSKQVLEDDNYRRERNLLSTDLLRDLERDLHFSTNGGLSSARHRIRLLDIDIRQHLTEKLAPQFIDWTAHSGLNQLDFLKQSLREIDQDLKSKGLSSAERKDLKKAFVVLSERDSSPFPMSHTLSLVRDVLERIAVAVEAEVTVSDYCQRYFALSGLMNHELLKSCSSRNVKRLVSGVSELTDILTSFEAFVEVAYRQGWLQGDSTLMLIERIRRYNDRAREDILKKR